MNKRDQMRELTAFDETGKWTVSMMSGALALMLFFAVEKGWISLVGVLVISEIAALPAWKKTWDRESIKKRYLLSREAKRLAHWNSITDLISYPFVIVFLYFTVTGQISTLAFFVTSALLILSSVMMHRLYEHHMVRLDENYVTERELREEQKWGSA
ncbi:hypothetical protein PJK55_13300 [Exiguobacterium sp. MMG028]|uniref:hypothetical protein n=1 Tax=Exiguobacterium sp. MMG028 TaxID=3021979 RepID=UPI0022FE4F9F|nr:hypothetical protein [Exiguobacterium sp. MMG028]MDA5561711.1 hypothetical protein [Exiguobacterium sp. MMG028]